MLAVVLAVVEAAGGKRSEAESNKGKKGVIVEEKDVENNDETYSAKSVMEYLFQSFLYTFISYLSIYLSILCVHVYLLQSVRAGARGVMVIIVGKWTRWHEFKSWMSLIAFHIPPLRKVWIQLFSFQLWVNCRVDCILQPSLGNQSRRRKTEFKSVKLRLKIDFVSHPTRVEGLGNIYSSLFVCINTSLFISIYTCLFISIYVTRKWNKLVRAWLISYLIKCIDKEEYEH